MVWPLLSVQLLLRFLYRLSSTNHIGLFDENLTSAEHLIFSHLAFPGCFSSPSILVKSLLSLQSLIKMLLPSKLCPIFPVLSHCSQRIWWTAHFWSLLFSLFVPVYVSAPEIQRLT